MSFEACAGIVHRGDPDRFLATMAAPVEARRVLFPLYAFNVEVARAPWASEEPLIAEMRLQWWADALDEIAKGGTVRRHEVVDALAPILDSDSARMLNECIDARRIEAHRETFTSLDALKSYLAQTGGSLHCVATRAIGVRDFDGPARSVGSALGLANYLLGVPAFLGRGHNPLPDMSEAEFGVLLDQGMQALAARASADKRQARIVDLAAWRAAGILKRAKRDQSAIVDGRLGGSEFARRAGLLWRSARI